MDVNGCASGERRRQRNSTRSMLPFSAVSSRTPIEKRPSEPLTQLAPPPQSNRCHAFPPPKSTVRTSARLVHGLAVKPPVVTIALAKELAVPEGCFDPWSFAVARTNGNLVLIRRLNARVP